MTSMSCSLANWPLSFSRSVSSFSAMMTVMRSIIPAYIALAGIYLALSIPASANVTAISPPVGPENSLWMVPGPGSPLPVAPLQLVLLPTERPLPAGQALPPAQSSRRGPVPRRQLVLQLFSPVLQSPYREPGSPYDQYCAGPNRPSYPAVRSSFPCYLS